MGGDRRSGPIEEQADWLLALVEDEKDLTLAEIRERLCDERGLRMSVAALWRFFDRHDVTWKKRVRTRPSKAVRTC